MSDRMGDELMVPDFGAPPSHSRGGGDELLEPDFDTPPPVRRARQGGDGDDLMEPSFDGPGLDVGRGLDADLVLGDLEKDMGGLDGLQRPDALAKLDQVAKAKETEVEQKVEKHETDAEKAGGEAEKGGGVAEPVAQQPRFQHPPRPKQPEQPPPDRDTLRAQITAAGQKEMAELETAYQTQLAQLEGRLTGQVGNLDTEIAKQTGRVDDKITSGDTSLETDIQARSAVHQKQISKEADAHAKLVAEKQHPLAEQADKDRAAATSAANADAELTKSHAAQKAQELRNNAKIQAAAARTSGATKAAEAIAAAETRAKQLSGDEASGVRADGNKRAQQARDEGEKQAKAIEAKGEAQAKQLITDGDTKAKAQVGRGGDATKGVDSEAARQGKRIQTQADISSAEMQSHAAAATGRMEAERGTFNQQAGGSKSTATTAMDAQRADVQKKTDQQKAETATKLKEAHESAKAKVQAKIDKLLGEVDSAKGNDLRRLGKHVGRELKALDHTSDNVELAMKKQVKRAEQKVKHLVAKAKCKVRAEANKARVAIDAFVREAKKRIVKADKGTDKDIAGAAKRGREAIENVGNDALTDLATANAEARDDLAKKAGADRAKLDTKVDQTTKEMTKLASGVAGTVDKQWLDDAVKEANSKLDDEGIFNVVTDGEAKRAMNVLTGLPPHLQGQAVEKLGKDQFDNLLDEVPFKRREELESLVKNTHDPERKLKLWGEFHKSQAQNDVQRHKGATGDDKWWWEVTDDDKEQRRRHEARQNAADRTEKEVDEEIKFLLKQQKDGRPYDEKAVNELMDRKQAEHVMEMKYNLNITNEEGVRKNGSKIVWTKQELDALEGSFGQIPLEHMAGNKKLKELRREDIALWDGKPKTSIGGMHSDGVITVFDSGSGTTGSAGFRHGGDNRELASPYICSKCGTKITVMDMVVTHEIGHDIHDQNDATFDKYKKASGWESHSEKDLKKAGLTDAEIQQMKTTRPQGYGSRTTIIKNGKIYMVDPYNKSGFLAVDDTALPAPQHADPTDPTKTVVESETGAGGTDKDTWAYARSNFKDHFAEHYAKAVHTPEKLYKDLVEHPAARTQELQTTVATWQQQLDALKAAGADATAIADRQKQIDAVNNELAHAQKAQKQRKAEFDIMRNDIFHADTATNDAYARLKSKGVSEDKLREFQEKAAQASTPEQIKTLETAY